MRSISLLSITLIVVGIEAVELIPKISASALAPNYYLGKRAVAGKRFGFSDITNAASDFSSSASDAFDQASAATNQLIDQGAAVGQDIQDNLPQNLDDIKAYAEASGVPVSAEEVQQLADELGVPYTAEDLMALSDEIEYDQLVEYLTDPNLDYFASVASSALSGAASESTMLSMEILEKLAEANILLEDLGGCKQEGTASGSAASNDAMKRSDGETVSIEKVDPNKEKRKVLERFVNEKKPSLLNNLNGKRPSFLNELNGKRPSFLNELNGKRPSFLNELNGKRPSFLNELNGKRGAQGSSLLYHWGKRGAQGSSFLYHWGKRSSDLSEQELINLLESGVGLVSDISPVVGDSSSNSAALYTILDGINEIVAKLQQLQS